MGKKKATQTPVTPKMEAEKLQDKKDAFTRVVPLRVTKAVKAIRLVAQCASPNYVSSDAQKRAVYTAINNEAQHCMEVFQGNTTSVGGFVLPD